VSVSEANPDVRPQGPHLCNLICVFCVFLVIVYPGISYNKEDDEEDGKYAKTMKLRVLSEEIRVGTDDEARNRKKNVKEIILLNSCLCRGPRGNY